MYIVSRSRYKWKCSKSEQVKKYNLLILIFIPNFHLDISEEYDGCCDPEDGAVEVDGARGARVEAAEVVELQTPGERLARQEQQRRHQQVDGGHPPQQRQRAKRNIGEFCWHLQYTL